MKQWVEKYIAELEKWNRVHKIIGRTPAPRLWKESSIALATLDKSHIGACLVDVGAGSGILGFPWLEMNEQNKALFVESDAKKVAFLHYVISQIPELKERVKVSAERIQNVSHETIQGWTPSYFLAARAFSGEHGLVDALKGSPIAQNAKKFVFSTGETLAKKAFLFKDIDLEE